MTARPTRPTSSPLSAKPANAGLSLAVPEQLVEAVADRVADKLAERLPNRSEPWLDVDAAAEYLACPSSRIYALVAEGRLRCAKDGRRSLFRTAWLDDVLKEDAA